jgi:hypothetical protein
MGDTVGASSMLGVDFGQVMESFVFTFTGNAIQRPRFLAVWLANLRRQVYQVIPQKCLNFPFISNITNGHDMMAWGATMLFINFEKKFSDS